MNISPETIQRIEAITCCPIALVSGWNRQDCQPCVTIVFHTEHGLFRWRVDVTNHWCINEMTCDRLAEAIGWFARCLV